MGRRHEDLILLSKRNIRTGRVAIYFAARPNKKNRGSRELPLFFCFLHYMMKEIVLRVEGLPFASGGRVAAVGQEPARLDIIRKHRL